ncbi:insulinase family protein [Tianweitania sp. BSSL-BM11]|uniref:Insulinase family protein n=1 Tax=Tianweitania aestuarii TaxID=2814886 RepID=A0ABS5RR25_9HYPH|nr:pitrilysin family protein [Tianweitania aestuarii]MBS9719500.1 insulinase family protein [Tianweitania aestuarii]
MMVFPTMARLKLAFVTTVLAFLLLAMQPLMAHAAVKIQKVTSQSGVTAWLVEDYSVPIVSMRFAFKGGSVQDPVGKEGLATLMSGLFDEGAGDLDRDAYQDRLDDSGAEISFSSTSDEIYGSFRAIQEDLDEGVDLLALAVQKPRFDPEPVERIRSQLLAGITARSRDPQEQAKIAWSRAVYGSHPYARQEDGGTQSLTGLTRDDLVAMHKAQFARDNLVVSVVGAIDAEKVKQVLDEVFGPLPEHAKLRDIPQADMKLGQDIKIDYDLPQTSIQLAYPGVDRKDPGFFAAYLMNEVLGGGTFSSRLFEEVREKRGLAYGVGSSLSTRRYSSALAIGTATRSDRADETLDLIRQEVKRMADEGPTQEELDKAKRYTIGAYAINNLDSSGSIAATLTQIQLEDLGIDYIERREGLIEAVTLDDVKAQAKRLLEAQPAIMIVGPAKADKAATPLATPSTAPAPAPAGELPETPAGNEGKTQTGG